MLLNMLSLIRIKNFVYKDLRYIGVIISLFINSDKVPLGSIPVKAIFVGRNRWYWRLGLGRENSFCFKLYDGYGFPNSNFVIVG